MTNRDEDRDESFGLHWPGKRRARQSATTPCTGKLLPCPADSIDWETTNNLMIEGDNLDVLKLLQPSYAGKVKLIYIDPPYNTGNEFVYRDNYGRRHAAWLSMMYPRLLLARELLVESGVIFVSIDENEAHHLRVVMDEIFGEQNFINVIAVKTKESSGASGGGEDKKLKKNVESLLLYCRDIAFFRRNDVFRREPLAHLIARKKAEGKSYEYRQVLTNPGGAELVGSIADGAGKEIKVFRRVSYEVVPIEQLAAAHKLSLDDAYARFHAQIFRTTNAQTSIRTRVHELLGEHEGLYSIEYVPRSGKDRGASVTKYFSGPATDLVVWLADTSVIEDGRVVKLHKAGTLWDDLAWTGIAKEGGVEFGSGKKPVAFIKRMIEMCMGDDPDGIVLDFFAGSGTTAQAVWELNVRDQVRRRFILVQLPDHLAANLSEQREAAAFCQSIGKPPILSELTKERLRRTGSKIRAENGGYQGDLGFRVLRCELSNVHD